MIKLFQSSANDELLGAGGQGAECWGRRESWWGKSWALMGTLKRFRARRLEEGGYGLRGRGSAVWAVEEGLALLYPVSC